MKKNVSLRITSTQYVENLKPSGEAFLRERMLTMYANPVRNFFGTKK